MLRSNKKGGCVIMKQKSMLSGPMKAGVVNSTVTSS